MKKLYRHELDFEQTFEYVRGNLGEVNQLSSQFLKLSVSKGNFYVLLPEGSDTKRIYEFNSGYITSFVDKEISRYVLDVTKKTPYSYIFDDVTVNASDGFKDEFSLKYSVFLNNEVYYLIKKESISEDLFLKCMKASNGIWHSLCLVTEIDFDDMPNKNLDENVIKKFCSNAQLAMIGAYDGEGYIFWERKDPLALKNLHA